jgi:Ca2+-binding EF-hand superfamily protein
MILISFDDLSRSVNNFMPPEEIIALFRIADIDRDGRLTYSEFKSLFGDGKI